MERIKPIERAVKLALASMLIVTMLALGGLAATNTAADGGISTLISAAHAATQQITAGNAVGAPLVGALNNPAGQTSPTTTTTVQQAAAPQQQQQQNAVLDARYADRVAG